MPTYNNTQTLGIELLFRVSLIFVTVLSLAGCQPEQPPSQQVQVAPANIHTLAARTDKRYVEIQPVGEFPRRPASIYKEVRLEKSVLVPMRDGVRLSTDIYSPFGAEGPLPVVMIRSPYNKNRFHNTREPGSDAHFFAAPDEIIATERQSIAVLPFVAMTSNQDDEYFSDGLTEELLNSLAQISGLDVAGRTSSFFYKGKTPSFQEVGEALGVAPIMYFADEYYVGDLLWFEDSPLLDSIRDEPRFKAVVERVNAANAAMLAELDAGLTLEDVMDEEFD